MTYTEQLLAGFMLQHISKLLEAYPITVGDFSYGQRVECREDQGNFTTVTVGIIRGFEFFDDDSDCETGLFYQVFVESGKAVFPDGTVRDVVSDYVERVRAEDIYPIDVVLPLVKSEITV